VSKVKFSKEQMVHEWNLPRGGHHAESVEDVELGTYHRWYFQRRLVFRVGEKFYRTIYCIGTGDHGVQPWEHENEVECEEVVPVTELKPVTRYEPVARK
jgi:hypothetical protein